MTKKNSNKQGNAEFFSQVLSIRDKHLNRDRFLENQSPITPLQALMNMLKNSPEDLIKVEGWVTPYLKEPSGSRPPFISFDSEVSRLEKKYQRGRSVQDDLYRLYPQLAEKMLGAIRSRLVALEVPSQKVDLLCGYTPEGKEARSEYVFSEASHNRQDSSRGSKIIFIVAALRLIYQDSLLEIIDLSADETGSTLFFTEEEMRYRLYIAMFFLDALDRTPQSKQEKMMDSLIGVSAYLRRGMYSLRNSDLDQEIQFSEMRGHLLRCMRKCNQLIEGLPREKESILPGMKEAIRYAFLPARSLLLSNRVSAGVKRAWTLTIDLITPDKESFDSPFVTPSLSRDFARKRNGISTWRDWEKEALMGEEILSSLKSSVLTYLKSTTVDRLPASFSSSEEVTLYKQLISSEFLRLAISLLRGEMRACGLPILSSTHEKKDPDPCFVSLFLDFLLDSLIKGCPDTYLLFKDALGLEELKSRFPLPLLLQDMAASSGLIADRSSLGKLAETSLIEFSNNRNVLPHLFIKDQVLPDPDSDGVTRMTLPPDFEFSAMGSSISPRRALIFSSTDSFDLPEGVHAEPGMIIAMGFLPGYFSQFTELGKTYLMTETVFFDYYSRQRASGRTPVFVGPHQFDSTRLKSKRDICNHFLIEPVDLTRLALSDFSVPSAIYLLKHRRPKINQEWFQRLISENSKIKQPDCRDHQIVGPLKIYQSHRMCPIFLTKHPLLPKQFDPIFSSSEASASSSYHLVDSLAVPSLLQLGFTDFSSFRLVATRTGRTPDLDLRNLHPDLMLSLPFLYSKTKNMQQELSGPYLGLTPYFRDSLMNRNHFRRTGSREILVKEVASYLFSLGFLGVVRGIMQLVRLKKLLPKLPSTLTENERLDIRAIVSRFRGLSPPQPARDYLHYRYANKLQESGWLRESIDLLFGALPEERRAYFESMRFLPFFGTYRCFQQVVKILSITPEASSRWRGVFESTTPVCDADLFLRQDLEETISELFCRSVSYPQAKKILAQLFLRAENSPFLVVAILVVKKAIDPMNLRNVGSYNRVIKLLEAHFRAPSSHLDIGQHGRSKKLNAMLSLFAYFSENHALRGRRSLEMPDFAEPVISSPSRPRTRATARTYLLAGRSAKQRTEEAVSASLGS